MRRASEPGPNVEAFAQKLFEGPLPWAKLRASQKLVSLGERRGGERLKLGQSTPTLPDRLALARAQKLDFEERVTLDDFEWTTTIQLDRRHLNELFGPILKPCREPTLTCLFAMGERPATRLMAVRPTNWGPTVLQRRPANINVESQDGGEARLRGRSLVGRVRLQDGERMRRPGSITLSRMRSSNPERGD